MTAAEWDFSDLEEIPFEGGGFAPVVKAGKKCRCCDSPVYAPRAVYCSPKSTCRSRYHRHPDRYQQQNATPVSSVAALTPDTIRQIIREEIAAAGGGSSRPAATQPRTPVKSAATDLDLLESIEIRKDESAAARSSQNFRNCLMAMQSGTGAWANSGART